MGFWFRPAGGASSTTTNSGGRYQLLIDGASTTHSCSIIRDFDCCTWPSGWQPISFPSGTQGQASVIVPSYATLRKRICGQNETGTEPQGFMAGYVRDASGKPVPRAHVWATWQILWSSRTAVSWPRISSARLRPIPAMMDRS